MMELLKIAIAFFTSKCDGQLSQIAAVFNKFFKVGQSAMIITTYDNRHFEVGSSHLCPEMHAMAK